MIEITARHMVGGTSNEHIAEVRYRNGNVTQTATRQAMVGWLDENKANQAIVYSPDRKSSAYVGVVHRSNAYDYIRSHADGTWNDNLLALPTY